MNKKIGKFKLWQLVAIGATIGLAVYLYNRNKAPATNPEETVSGTGTGAFGPINPDTGIPYAFEGSSGSAGEPQSLSDLLDQFAQLQGLMGGGGETYTETIVQEPGEHTPLTQTKNHKPKTTGDAASNKHSHRSGNKLGINKARATRSHPATHAATQARQSNLAKSKAEQARSLQSQGKAKAAQRASQAAKKARQRAKLAGSRR